MHPESVVFDYAALNGPIYYVPIDSLKESPVNNESRAAEQAAAHRADVRTVYASGAKTRKQARKALADRYAQDRGLKPDARTLFGAIQTVKSEHIRRILAQPIHDELNQAAAGLVDEG